MHANGCRYERQNFEQNCHLFSLLFFWVVWKREHLKSINFWFETHKIIEKKVEVSLRLFDIFEGNMVFIFLLGSWGSHPAD